MKGTIEKINDNWMVILDKRTWQDPSAEDLILPLHIDDLWLIDHTSYILGERQELNFEILTVEDGVTDCGTHIIYKDYAKLTLKENHIVNTNEMVSSQTEHNSPKVENKTSFGEISDEEIEEQSWGYREVTKDMEIPPNEDWSNGAKWYREQLKQRQ